MKEIKNMSFDEKLDTLESNILKSLDELVVDDDTIKEVGNYKAKVRLHKDVTVEISFEVFAE